MPDIEKLMPDKIPEQYRIILIIAAIIATCLALYLVVSLLTALIRAVMRHVVRRRFSDQHSIRVPPKVEVRRNKTPTTNTYVLRCPAWQHAKKDGTRDRRHKANRIVPRRSVMRTGEWEISSYDPVLMNSFVTALRRDGNALPVCKQEMDKQGRVTRERNGRFVGSSELQLYAHFMDDSTGFEEWCAQLLRDGGAQVRVTPPSNDGGYDLDIRKDGIRTIAECKCYHPTEGTVGRPLLQKLVGANASEHAERMAFLTTGRYSSPAVEYASEQGIELLDGKSLMRLDATRRGGASVTQGTMRQATSLDDWILSKEDVMAGYPADYSDRHMLKLKGLKTGLLLLIELALVAGLVYWFLNMRSQHLGLFPHGTTPAVPNASGMPDAADGDSEADEPTDDSARESTTGANPSPDPGYVLPESDSGLVPLETLMGMSAHDLFVARNEIYARHGCIFETESLREHFGACPWYVPKTPSADFDDGELSRIERENVRRILGVEMPKTMGRTTYVASYYTREHAEQHPDRSCAYNGHVDGNLLQIEGTWDISDDGGHTDMNCTQWCFRLSDDLRVQSSGGDAPDANLHVMTREELRDMLGDPSGLGLRLVTNDDGQVTEIDWMS